MTTKNRREAKLKRALIRLAYAKPGLRADLLPLVKEAGYDLERLKRLQELDGGDSFLTEKLKRELARHGGGPIPVGETMENGKIRAHRFASAVRVWDLTNAGRRGKNVDIFVMYDLDRVKGYGDLIDAFTASLRKSDYQTALRNAEQVMSTIHAAEGSTWAPKLEKRQEKGVRVDPPGQDPINISTPLLVARIEPQDFFFKDLTDKYNEPAIMPRKRKRSATKKVYAWAQQNQDKIQRMSLSEVMDTLRSMKVDFHYWLMMD